MKIFSSAGPTGVAISGGANDGAVASIGTLNPVANETPTNEASEAGIAVSSTAFTPAAFGADTCAVTSVAVGEITWGPTSRASLRAAHFDASGEFWPPSPAMET